VVADVSAANHGRAAGGTATWSWTLMLPPNWTTLPTEPAAARTAVKGLLARQMAHLPRDRVAGARRQLESELRTLLRQAEDAGAKTVHACFALMRGLPVSATCTVTLLEGGVDDPRLLAELATRLAADEAVVEIDVRPLAGLPAIRRRRRRSMPVEGTERAVTSTGLDWAVPLPDGDGALVLAFGTTTDPVAEQLVALFDAMAGSLQLTPAGG
jgi:hypothetical protein